MGELTNLWELVQTRIANSIFLDQAEVEPKMESFFFFLFPVRLWILATPLTELLSLHRK